MENKKVINMVGVQCSPDVEEKFNKWYDEVHVPMLFKNEGIRKVTRYKKLGGDEAYPAYLAVYEFNSKGAFEAYSSGPELAAALEEMKETWREGGFVVSWRVQYQATKTWQK